MIHATGRKFTEHEDNLIREHWGKIPSHVIGSLMVPPRDGSPIRVRAHRLGLPRIGELFKARPGNLNAAKANSGRRKPSMPVLTCLADMPAITQAEIRIRAQDFIRWRLEQRA